MNLRNAAMCTSPSQSRSAHGSPSRRKRIGLWVIVPVAMLARLAHLWSTRELPFLQHPVGDAEGYIAWATRIAGGDWIGSEPFYQAPLYPYLLGALFRVVGVRGMAVLLAQSMMGSFAALALAATAGRIGGRRAAWVAGLMYALYPPAIFFDGIIQKASLAGALTCLLLLLVTVGSRRWRAGRAVAAGAVTGLLALTRENAFVWLALIAGWLLVHGRQVAPLNRRLIRCGAYLAGAAFVLGPVAARNGYVGGEMSFSTFQMGPNFYIGNSLEATGRYRPLVRGHETPEFERADAARLAQEALGRVLSASEVSHYWLDRAWVDICSAPGQWVRLTIRKVLMAVNAYEVSDVESFRVYADHSLLLGTVGKVWHFGTLLPLAGAGMMLSRRRSGARSLHGLLFAGMCIAVAGFYVLGRYRFPLAAVLTPFAAAGLVRAIRAARGRRTHHLHRALAVAAILAFVANAVRVHPEQELDGMGYSNLGVCYARAGKLDAAVTCLRRAVEANPTAEALYNLGLALSQTRQWSEAVVQFRAASAADPSLMEVDYQCGAALESLGRREEAAMRYRRALDLDPQDERARTGLERLSRSPPGGSGLDP
ncbi:MAG: tetratricopeptide repeat protein [Phycisphaerales bacterium]|nr:tetratricopeptide repeat protein [Phycisphaerales bacterium]